MPIQLAIFLGIQALAIVLYSLAALLSVYSQRQKLQQETGNIAAGSPVQEAYQRFVAARFRTLLTARRTNIYILFSFIIVFLAFSWVQPAFNDMLIDASGNPFADLLTFICMLVAALIGLYIGVYVLDVAGTILVDLEAHEVFQLGNLPQEVVIRQKVRKVLLRLVPLICYLEGVALVLTILPNLLFLVLLLAISLIIYFVVTQVFAATFYALGTSLRPLEQTEWAYLAERIAQWARLGGVTFSSIQIEYDLIGS